MSADDNGIKTAYVNLSKNMLLEAKEAFELSLRKSKSAEAFNGLGLVFFKMESYDDAVKCFKKALKLNSENDEISYNLARSYVKLGRVGKPKKILKKIVEKTDNVKLSQKSNKLIKKLESLEKETNQMISESRGVNRLLYSMVTKTGLSESSFLGVWLAILPFVIGLISMASVYFIQNNTKTMVEELWKGYRMGVVKDTLRSLDKLNEKETSLLFSLDDVFAEYLDINTGKAPEEFKSARVEFVDNCKRLEESFKNTRSGEPQIKQLDLMIDEYIETSDRIGKEIEIENTENAQKILENTKFDKMIEKMQVLLQQLDMLNATDLQQMRENIDTAVAKSNFVFASLIFICILGIVTSVPSRTVQNYQKLRIQTSLKEIEGNFAKLKEMDRVKTQFFSNVSHELRTPLTLIIGPIQSILEGQLGEVTPQQRQYLETMEQNGRRLLRLINNLLDMAKLEAERMTLSISRVDIVEMAGFLSSSVSSLAERKNIRLKTKFPDKKIEDLYVDHEKMEKVILNLLSNALKFTPSGGTVKLLISDRSDTVDITVSDTGEGIPAKYLKSIFDRFSQADSSTVRKHEGSGIGLSLVKEFVNLHGGTVSVESQLGEGTQFTVTLKKGYSHFSRGTAIDDASKRAYKKSSESVTTQMSDIQEKKKAGEAKKAVASTGRRKKILVVDDNADIIKYLDMILSDKYDVFSAMDGVEGLEMAMKEKPDVLISDVMMPRKDGYELCGDIKSNPEFAHIPVILLTAKAETEMKVEGLELGADDYLSKPFNARELLARVNAILRMKELEREIREKNEQLSELNKSLELKVRKQVDEISKISELKRYISPQAAEAAIRKGGVKLQTQKKYVTIFFSDIRGFTQAAEEMTPEETISLLNEYLTEMTKIVFKHGGTLDKFIGDGMMAIFGDVDSNQDHAGKAVGMALEMQKKMEGLNQKWAGERKRMLEIGIGIHTGFATVGNIGSDDRMDYTAIGRTVNMAARLQGIASGGDIVISEETKKKINDNFICGYNGQTQLKGIFNPVNTYKVLSES